MPRLYAPEGSSLHRVVRPSAEVLQEGLGHGLRAQLRAEHEVLNRRHLLDRRLCHLAAADDLAQSERHDACHKLCPHEQCQVRENHPGQRPLHARPHGTQARQGLVGGPPEGQLRRRVLGPAVTEVLSVVHDRLMERGGRMGATDLALDGQSREQRCEKREDSLRRLAHLLAHAQESLPQRRRRRRRVELVPVRRRGQGGVPVRGQLLPHVGGHPAALEGAIHRALLVLRLQAVRVQIPLFRRRAPVRRRGSNNEFRLLIRVGRGCARRHLGREVLGQIGLDGVVGIDPLVADLLVNLPVLGPLAEEVVRAEALRLRVNGSGWPA
mmetsp:Transcript_14474/g.50879  ORF Transcript_14474/g.50879 Transcript_14474/m.50879 type:complete len:325 (+) Transcript_14474:1063-2037(+)